MNQSRFHQCYARPLLVVVYAGLLLFCGCSSASRQEQQETSQQETSPLKIEQREKIESSVQMAMQPPVTAQQVGQWINAGQWDEADQAIRGRLTRDPNDAAWLFLAARSAHGQAKHSEAIAFLRDIPPEHPEAGLPALGQAADWLMELDRLEEAEATYRSMLQQFGDLVPVHRRLADLLNDQGRRVEAAVHTRALIQMGDVTEKELLGLTTLSVPYHDDALADRDENSSLTLRGLARAKQRLVQNQLSEANTLLAQLRTQFPDNTAVAAAQGRLYETLQSDEDLRRWSRTLPDGIEREAEYWMTLGLWTLRNGRPNAAIRSLLESVRIDPTDRLAYLRLAEALAMVEKPKLANRVLQRKQWLDEAWQMALNVGLQRDTRVQDLETLAETLDQLGRPWEAVAWRAILAHEQGRIEQVMPALMQTRAKLSNRESLDPAASDPAALDPAADPWCGIDAAQWPLPDQTSLADFSSRAADLSIVSSEPKPTHRSQPILLRDVASELGVDFQFQNNLEPELAHVYMNQVNGGGITVIDLDLDGWSDLYFCNAGGPAHDAEASASNRMFRNLNGLAMQDISVPTATDDRSYAQGATTADLNQDGFMDLVVANIGVNILYVNNGDGTMTAHPIEGSGGWTSSLVCGDLNGDALPDMVEINYIDDARAFTTRCWGNGFDCTPRIFQPAKDRFRSQSSDGRWIEANALSQPPDYGFAGVLANFDRRGGNDLFVSNDTTNNHFWINQTESDSNTITMDDQAVLRGCAVGDNATPQGCMGIATGDFDRDGSLDLCVTNYWDQPTNLYLQRSPGFFTDAASQFGLSEPSRETVGFGVQAIDLDRDGWLDLTVLNGHVFDPVENGTPEIPFQMKPQLFQGGPGGMTLQTPSSIDPATPAEFWEKPTLGRTLVRWDFNRDGKPDLVANSLDAPISILQNETSGGHWLRLDLIGTDSERDAIGAEVIAACGDQTWHQWVVGGGYMGSNESTLDIGIDHHTKITQLTIIWPSGRQQVFENVTADTHHLLVEGMDEILIR